MSYAGARQPVPPEDDPLAAFSRLFGNASPELREKRRSVLDSVTADYAALDAKLGGADRQRLDAHLTAIREIEKGLDKAPFRPHGICQIPSYDRPADIYADASYDAVGKAQMDLLVMAMACDLTRIASLQWGLGVAMSACTGDLGDPLPAKLDPGPSPMRRMTRVEYDHAVRDLLGDTPGPHFGALSAAVSISDGD